MPTHLRSLQSTAVLRPLVGTAHARLTGAGRNDDEAADRKAGRMIRRLEQSEGRVIGYSISGDFEVDDYDQTISELRDDIAREGTIRVLFRLSDVPLTSFLPVLDQDLRFLKEHQDDIERCAFVTDDTAAATIGRLGDLLPSIDV
jgi:hypothetical protein